VKEGRDVSSSLIELNCRDSRNIYIIQNGDTDNIIARHNKIEFARGGALLAEKE
jgi:hypothetical protein